MDKTPQIQEIERFKFSEVWLTSKNDAHSVLSYFASKIRRGVLGSLYGVLGLESAAIQCNYEISLCISLFNSGFA